MDHMSNRTNVNNGVPAASTPPQPQRSFSTSPKKTSRFPKKLVPIALAVLLLLVGFVAAWKFFGPDRLINGGQYQAVFLTNGQVYFGKLHQVNGEYYRLTDIYYLQVADDLQAESKDGNKEQPANNETQLIKLGEELHGPNDEMVIPEAQILFFENIRDDGTVGKAIQSDKNK